ncbi:MAG: glycosyltransferase family 4 protein [Flavobacteriales bacterium]
MKIAVNTRLLLSGKLDGIGWFTYENFKRITQQHPEHEFHFFFDRSYSREFIFSNNVFAHVLPPQARRPFLFACWYDYTVPYMLRRIGAQLFISPDAMMSLRTDVPQLIAMHDLNFEHYPNDLKRAYSIYLRARSPLFAARAKRIVTVSEFSKADIAMQYNTPPEKIDVVYNGVNEQYGPLSELVKQETQIRFSEGKPYFVFVSSIHPRKNLQRLLPAFDAFKMETGSDVRLLVVGKKFWFNTEIESAYNQMKHRESIVFTGRLEPADLNHVVASSIASVYPSYFEGFGIPIVEAFRCGVPVITSNVTSMPEVAGDAALLIDPFSVEEIKQALIRIYGDAALRERLIVKGKEQVKQFSWQRTSELLWNSIEKCVAS